MNRRSFLSMVAGLLSLPTLRVGHAFSQQALIIDSQSGFSSADIKSTAGMNAVMKAMHAQNSHGRSIHNELKRHGDIIAEQLKALKQLRQAM